MKFVHLLHLVGGVACALAVSRRDGYAVKDRHVVPAGWTRRERAAGEHTLRLRIGLKQKSFGELERQLYEVSDPAHARYGQHLSTAEVHALVAPDDDALDAVHAWLAANGIPAERLEHSAARDWVVVALPVDHAERLLDTEYHVYENGAGTTLVRTPQYSLPVGLHAHVDVIQPTNYFGDPKAMGRPFRTHVAGMGPGELPTELSTTTTTTTTTTGADADGLRKVCNETAVTNLCLRTLYKTVDYVPRAPHDNAAAICAYLNDTANFTDFHVFLSQQRPDAAPTYLFNVTTIAGGANDQRPVPKKEFGNLDVESNLDTQTVGGFVYPTDFRVFSTGGLAPFRPDLFSETDTNEPYLTWLNFMLTLDDPPHTISTSYGDDEQSVPPRYAKRVCEEMAQLGARGVTLLFASGDDGVGPNGTCRANDGSDRRLFLPEFPTSCPYVTSVGATRGFEPEIVAFDVGNGFVSGGGVSNYFARPAYQQDVVDGYFDRVGNLHHALYNHSGRAYPDIAAQGFHFVITYAGKNIGVDGTSASTPTAAGVLTLVNDALVADRRPPLGFFNPALYRFLHRGFTDVTQGNIWGCNTSGFPAMEGWDLASGWGTPDFEKIRELALGGWQG